MRSITFEVIECRPTECRFFKNPKEIILQQSRFQKLQDHLGKWADETFGPRTPESLLCHLKDEIDEIVADPKDEHEWADALQLLTDAYRLATGNTTEHLLDACFEKLEINKNRTWNAPDENGCFKHVKP
jgi:hypothetical protein